MGVFGLCACKVCGAKEGDEGVSLMSYNQFYEKGKSYEIEFEVRCSNCGLKVVDDYDTWAIRKWNLLNDT